jgi:hypothetical protein
MARKVSHVTLADRGEELHFIIEEMSATQLQRWVGKAIPIVAPLLGLEANDINGAVNALQTVEGLAKLVGLEYEKVEPLLYDMLRCCTRKIDGKAIQKCTPETVDGYIQDFTTLFKLEIEALKLNLGFLQGESANQSSSPENPSLSNTLENTVKVSLHTPT